MSAPIREQRCETCACWRKNDGENQGECYAHPPQVMNGGFTRRPLMPPKSYCVVDYRALPVAAPPESKGKVRLPVPKRDIAQPVLA